MNHWDVTIVGAGVIGLSLARQLSQAGYRVLVVEQHQQVGQETSSRNSEVIHAGLYYPTNSLKARLCVAGNPLLYAYCDAYGVAYRRIGKFIVASDENQRVGLAALAEKAIANGVTSLQHWDADRVRQQEPALRVVAALWSPDTGIVDSHGLLQALVAHCEYAGGMMARGTRFERAEAGGNGFKVWVTSQGEPFQYHCTHIINAAGLHAPSVAAAIDGMPEDRIPRLHYCKGVYFSWQGRSPFKHLIYPVADPNAIGLGVHATLDLAGQLRFGPDTEYIDSLDYGLNDTKRLVFAEAIARYFPGVDEQRLIPAYAGIRPKLQGPGEPFADFNIQTATEHGVTGLVNLFGFESPGLTSALALADQWVTLVGDAGFSH